MSSDMGGVAVEVLIMRESGAVAPEHSRQIIR